MKRTKSKMKRRKASPYASSLIVCVKNILKQRGITLLHNCLTTLNNKKYYIKLFNENIN